MGRPIDNSRDLAVAALRDRQGNISARLDRLLGMSQLSPADRGLANELALGVVRHRGMLNAVIRAYLKHPARGLPGAIREILRVAIYQILFCDRVPDFAAVDQAVDQTTRFKYKRQVGMVNGLLRSFLRDLAKETEATDTPAVDVIPITAGQGRRISKTIFLDPKEHPAEYLAGAYSLPTDLARRWIKRLRFPKARLVAAHGLSRPPLIARVNSRLTDVASVLKSLADDGVAAQPHVNTLSVVIESAAELTRTTAFREGLIQPQDSTATAVIAGARVKPGMRVLDFCAAPGTKTTHLAERMNNEGELIAVDVSPEKLERIEENNARMGITCVKTYLANEIGPLPLRGFDVVLADVPCSHTGVFARRPEAKWRFDETKITKLVHDQQFLLHAAAQFVAPGGQLIYSTCSIDDDEANRVVKGVANRVDHIRPARQKLTLPGGATDPTKWHDGGFVALLEGR